MSCEMRVLTPEQIKEIIANGFVMIPVKGGLMKITQDDLVISAEELERFMKEQKNKDK